MNRADGEGDAYLTKESLRMDKKRGDTGGENKDPIGSKVQIIDVTSRCLLFAGWRIRGTRSCWLGTRKRA